MPYEIYPFTDNLYDDVAKKTGLPRDQAKLLCYISQHPLTFIARHIPGIELDKLEGHAKLAIKMVRERGVYTERHRRPRGKIYE